MITDTIKPLLQYSIGSTPFPLHVNDSDGASLQVMASNNTGGTVKLYAIAIQFPLGNNSTDLSADTGYTPVPPDGWKYTTSLLQGAVQYVFTSQNGDPVNIQHQSTLIFFFNDVTINATPGIAEIQITEGSAPDKKDSPVQNLFVSKFPEQWGNVSFTVDTPVINTNQSANLSWNGPGGDTATYKISYTTPLSGPVTVPPDGTQPFKNIGTYATPDLTETTTFTLIVLDEIEGKEYSAFAQVTVTVVMSAAQITEFNGHLTHDAYGQPQLIVNWQSTGATCTISGDSTIHEPNSLDNEFIISFSPEKPLLSAYTLIAQNDLGPSTPETLQINWGLASNAQVNNIVYYSVLSPDGTRLYVATFNTVCIYDTKTLKQVGNTITLSGENVPAGTLAITPDGKKLFVGYSDATIVQIISINGDTLTLTGNQITDLLVTSMQVSADGTKLYVLSPVNSLIAVYDIREDVPTLINQFTHGNVFAFSLSSDEKFIYVITNDGSQSYLFRLTVATFQIDIQPFLLPGIAGGVFASPDSKSVLVSNSFYQVFSIYQPEEGGINPFSLVNEFDAAPDNSYMIQGVWISPDSYYAFVLAATETGSANVNIYNMVEQSSINIPLTTSGNFLPGIQLPLAASADGTLLAAYVKNTTSIWTFKPVSVSGGVSSSNFSIAGQQQIQ